MKKAFSYSQLMIEMQKNRIIQRINDIEREEMGLNAFTKNRKKKKSVKK